MSSQVNGNTLPGATSALYHLPSSSHLEIPEERTLPSQNLQQMSHWTSLSYLLMPDMGHGDEISGFESPGCVPPPEPWKLDLTPQYQHRQVRNQRSIKG